MTIKIVNFRVMMYLLTAFFTFDPWSLIPWGIEKEAYASVLAYQFDEQDSPSVFDVSPMAVADEKHGKGVSFFVMKGSGFVLLDFYLGLDEDLDLGSYIATGSESSLSGTSNEEGFGPNTNIFNIIDSSGYVGTKDGGFEVFDIAYSDKGELLRFAADFYQNASVMAAGITGGIRYNSDLALFSSNSSQRTLATSLMYIGGDMPIPSMISSEPVPEPATMLLFGAGLTGLMGFQRSRRKLVK